MTYKLWLYIISDHIIYSDCIIIAISNYKYFIFGLDNGLESPKPNAGSPYLPPKLSDSSLL